MTKPTSPTRLTFGPVIRFRSLEGDRDILQAAAEAQGQTLSAYIRAVAMAAALDDLGCSTRDEAMKRIRKPKRRSI